MEPEGYLHLTCEQRCQIYALLQSGHSQAHIARKIGVDPSTISRELVRNTGARGYRFKQAHEKASQRRKEASDKPRKMTPDLVELVEEKLTQEQWSPDQISGRLAKDGVACISHERIYQHVWKDKKDAQSEEPLRLSNADGGEARFLTVCGSPERPDRFRAAP
jgi:transposase, IS30 family